MDATDSKQLWEAVEACGLNYNMIQKGRCRECKQAYFWQARTLKLKDARCPLCKGRLKATTHLLTSVEWKKL